LYIAIDFDGVIVEAKYPEMGDLIPGTVEAIKKLHDDGHHLILWTCREDKCLQEALDVLLINDILSCFDTINENHPDLTALYQHESRKVGADCYVDDRNVGGFLGWERTLELVEELERARQRSMQEMLGE